MCAGAVGVRRVGFAYATLPDHGRSGEDRFTVAWPEANDSMWYDLNTVSRPGYPLARLDCPIARRLQRRSAAASKRARVRRTASKQCLAPCRLTNR
jgi:uncharacterized protein (UPF0548 family)